VGEAFYPLLSADQTSMQCTDDGPYLKNVITQNMSFPQLKSTRSTKSNKSYVQTSIPSGRIPLVSASDDISASHIPKQSEELRRAIEDGLYSDLPESIAVIDTEDRGRGLATNLSRTAGKSENFKRVRKIELRK
jgi:hypothetical protein